MSDTVSVIETTLGWNQRCTAVTSKAPSAGGSGLAAAASAASSAAWAASDRMHPGHRPNR